MATSRGEEAAEKAYRLAENRFLANDIAGALREAREAQRHFRALPGLANAVTAYKVHAAAATSRASGGNWYAVLAVGGRPGTTSSGNAATHESLKQQYRRLCLILHPDKNRSAAADGAFKLLREAWDELSRRHPPGSAAAPVSRPPPATAQASNSKPQQARPRTRTVHCPHCGFSFASVIDDEFFFGVKCLHCKQQVSKPLWQSRPAPASGPPPRGREAEPPPPPKPSPPPPPPRQRETTPPPQPRRRPSKSWKFPCPGQCAKCGAKFTATVSVGTWHLRCDACHTYAMVYVKSASLATTG